MASIRVQDDVVIGGIDNAQAVFPVGYFNDIRILRRLGVMWVQEWGVSIS